MCSGQWWNTRRSSRAAGGGGGADGCGTCARRASPSLRHPARSPPGPKLQRPTAPYKCGAHLWGAGSSAPHCASGDSPAAKRPDLCRAAPVRVAMAPRAAAATCAAQTAVCSGLSVELEVRETRRPLATPRCPAGYSCLFAELTSNQPKRFNNIVLRRSDRAGGAGAAGLGRPAMPGGTAGRRRRRRAPLMGR